MVDVARLKLYSERLEENEPPTTLLNTPTGRPWSRLSTDAGKGSGAVAVDETPRSESCT
jgi:hypothetical protein